MIVNRELNSSLYLLLPLAVDENQTAETIIGKYSNALIDGFSMDINKPWIDNAVHIAFDREKYRDKSISQIEKQERFNRRSLYRIENKFYEVYSIELNDDYKFQIELILKGKSFLIDEETKAKIMEFWDAPAKSKVFRILYKESNEDKAIDAEIISPCEYQEQKERELQRY